MDAKINNGSALTNHGPNQTGLYGYTPLPSKDAFRILKLLPGKSGEPISYELQVAPIGDSCPYEAISYAWGDANVTLPSHCKNEIGSAGVINITTNLYACLAQLRHEETPRSLWADAICINQNDASEQSHQVNSMQRIYQCATRVLVWLGPDSNGRAEVVVKMVDEIYSSVWSHYQSRIDHLALGKLHWESQSPTLSRVDSDQAWEFAKQTGSSLILHELDHFGPLVEGLPSDGHSWNQESLWEGFTWYLSFPWYQRLWVFQEVNANENCLVLCGSTSTSWDKVSLAASLKCTWWATEPDHTHQKPTWCFRNAQFMRNRYLQNHWDALEMLQQVQDFQVTDPRDMIYALLGTPAFNKKEHWIRPDYSRSVEVVYRNFALACIDHFGNLDVLSFVYLLAGSPASIELPTWVPDWTAKRPGTMTMSNVDWNASRGMPVSLERCLDWHILVEGIRFDTISSVTANLRDESSSMSSDEFLHLWRKHAADGTWYAGGGSTDDALAETLTCGVDWDRMRARENGNFHADYRAYVQSLLAPKYDDISSSAILPGNAQVYARILAEESKGRLFFTTLKNYMGLCRYKAKQGDVICVLLGATVPYLLRPVGEGTWRLICEAYVHGIMDGEAIDLLESHQLERETFELY